MLGFVGYAQNDQLEQQNLGEVPPRPVSPCHSALQCARRRVASRAKASLISGAAADDGTAARRIGMGRIMKGPREEGRIGVRPLSLNELSPPKKA